MSLHYKIFLTQVNQNGFRLATLNSKQNYYDLNIYIGWIEPTEDFMERLAFSKKSLGIV